MHLPLLGGGWLGSEGLQPGHAIVHQHYPGPWERVGCHLFVTLPPRTLASVFCPVTTSRRTQKCCRRLESIACHSSSGSTGSERVNGSQAAGWQYRDAGCTLPLRSARNSGCGGGGGKRGSSEVIGNLLPFMALPAERGGLWVLSRQRNRLRRRYASV